MASACDSNHEWEDVDNELIVPLSLSALINLSRETLDDIHSLGCVEAIVLCQDASSLNEMKIDGYDFCLLVRFTSVTEELLSLWMRQVSSIFDHNKLAASLHWTDGPTEWVVECDKYLKMRMRNSALVKKRGVTPDQVGILQFWFLRVFCGLVLNNFNLPGPDRHSCIYNHVLIEELFRKCPSVYPMLAPGHRQILKTHKKLRLVVRNLIECIMESSPWFSSNQLFAVLLMPVLEAFKEKKQLELIKMPKCHCAASIAATSAVYTVDEVPRGYRKNDMADMTTFIMRTICDSTFAIEPGHAHFCGNCGLFETKDKRMKVCKLCKEQQILTRFMFCSNQCQIKSWPCHKWLHRARKVMIESRE